MTGRARSALPLGVRNRLAELILDAFDRPESRLALGALADLCRGADRGAGAEAVQRLCGLGWLEPSGTGRLRLRGVDQAHEAALCERVMAAEALLRTLPARSDPSGGESLAGLLGRAALLADAGLYFEVHELLEPAWLRAEGGVRVGLQALIQIAVALHHAVHGNYPGAASLLGEGLAKLEVARGALPLATVTWEAVLGEMLETLRRGGAPDGAGVRLVAPAWPRPGAGVPGERSTS
jgi:hypothetical protein